MKRILIEHFQSLDNYGTGMMGLVMLQALADRYGADNVEFYCDFASEETLRQVQRELRVPLRLFCFVPVTQYTAEITNVWGRRLHRLFHLLFSTEGRGFDRVVVLGGDDFSEYYSMTDPCVNLFKKWKSSFLTRVVLPGQTLGPFSAWYNRRAVEWLLPRLEVYARDAYSVNYMQREFGVQIALSADLAFADLPLQGDVVQERAVLEQYGLEKDGYYTVVVSAGQQGGKYYCRSEADYLRGYAEMIATLSRKEALKDKRIVLLAHTFGRYGDESGYLMRLFERLPEAMRERVQLVTEKIYPTRARFILGNGLLTLTGRMHAAVSTFQMGRPAICLSYSAKFLGVIGESLGQEDLVIEADQDGLWRSGDVVTLVSSHADRLLADYSARCERIAHRVAALQKDVAQMLDRIAADKETAQPF